MQPGGVSTEIVEPTSVVTSAMVDDLINSLPPSDILLAMGSIPPGAGEDVYGRCAGRTKPSTAIIDTNSMTKLQHFCDADFEGSVILKCNVGEILSIAAAGEGVELDDACIKTVFDVSPKITAILLTDGANPAHLAQRGENVTKLALPDIAGRVKNPIGAGDATAAGVAWGLAKGKTIEESFKLGLRVGAASCLEEGCIGINVSFMNE